MLKWKVKPRRPADLALCLECVCNCLQTKIKSVWLDDTVHSNDCGFMRTHSYQRNDRECFISIQLLDGRLDLKEVVKCLLLFLSLTTRTLHQQFESYKEQVRRIGAENKRQQSIHKDDAPTCGICRKTKFADGCGHLCSYCQTKFCARCGGRVSLRSNNVRNSQ